VNYYGYAWWMTKYKNEDVFYMRGIQGQYVFCIPSKNMIVVRLGEKRVKAQADNTPLDVYAYINEAMLISKSIPQQ
jgi:CubicO group peptidase (beta-lactamase class C family)